MKYKTYTPDIIDFAYQIIALHEENLELRHENKHFREIEKINNNIIDEARKHSAIMMTNLITAMLTNK